MSHIKKLSGYVWLWLVMGVLTLIMASKLFYDYNTAVVNYKTVTEKEAITVADTVNNELEQVYHNIRTISMLPSVMSIDRYGKNLSANDKMTIQQIYNNLATAVAVSEVYVVPASLDPDKIDPETGEKEVPILMFDQVITSAQPDAAEAGDTPPAHEEVETDEYAQFKETMKWYQANHPRRDPALGLNIPMTAGREVITCDNTDYDATLKDEDRSGVMFSVPFYGEDGAFKGTISAIMRTNKLRDLLPNAHFEIKNAAYDYTVTKASSHNKGETSLIFDKDFKLNVPDAMGAWVLWAGYDYSDFYATDAFDSLTHFALIALGILMAVLFGGLHVLRNNERMRADVVQQREKAAESFERQIAGIANMLASAVTQLKGSATALSHIAEETNTQAVSVAATSEQVTANVNHVATAAGALSDSIRSISQEVSQSNEIANVALQHANKTTTTVAKMADAAHRVSDVLHSISAIANQTNLLALNATIEAARAGEAGKGFAVVAGEVKNLAAQTAKATDDISEEISNIKAVAAETVEAMRAINETIQRMNTASAAIDKAVSQQAHATADISSNVREVASSNEAVSSSIRTVSMASTESGTVTDQVLVATENLDALATKLNLAVQSYLGEVRHG